ncbi:Rhamnosyl O-methyltransferase precursor [Rosistilla carotiformis]|uniref:Rhamnosyl O-methyltransferase n=1 Tax=Rosistilla carotiformis TaxID=2528017 RepID=A0A518JQ19_9BACT|nr:CmcI family methyltransferase [Rosistilla carotiformis]QDV67633.1 Rhamnosyl O-methyltransferase precursor [Rosistilla carotiformis]
MQISIDTEQAQISIQENGDTRQLPLYSKAGYELLSDLWTKVGWNEKQIYTYTWFGRPIIQLSQDMIRTQEAIYQVRPDVIVETGVAHGGSLVYYASLMKAMGRGRVIGVDVEIRKHNREAIESHELASMITLVEGDSISDEIVNQVKSLIQPGETVMVLLDSCHTKDHVLGELNAYHDLVSPGSYIVATDGIMKDVYDTPRGEASWEHDHPTASAAEFAATHPEFELVAPPWTFNESELTEDVTHWPGAWLRRR